MTYLNPTTLTLTEERAERNRVTRKETAVYIWKEMHVSFKTSFALIRKEANKKLCSMQRTSMYLLKGLSFFIYPDHMLHLEVVEKKNPDQA